MTAQRWMLASAVGTKRSWKMRPWLVWSGTISWQVWERVFEPKGFGTWKEQDIMRECNQQPGGFWSSHSCFEMLLDVDDFFRWVWASSPWLVFAPCWSIEVPEIMRDWRLFSHLLAGRQGLLVGSSPWHPQNSGPCFSFVGPGVEGVQFTFQQMKHRYGKPTAGKPWAMLSCCARETMGWSPAWRKTAPLAVQVMPCASWRMVPLDSNQSSWRAAGMWPLRHCERFAAEGCHGENFKAQS